LKVMGRCRIRKVEVGADGSGLSSRAGTGLLALVAGRLGLTDSLGWALAETRVRRSAHDPGRVFCDLAVMLADGGRCVSDLVALGSQPALFGLPVVTEQERTLRRQAGRPAPMCIRRESAPAALLATSTSLVKAGSTPAFMFARVLRC
jgi:hypothetical protein